MLPKTRFKQQQTHCMHPADLSMPYNLMESCSALMAVSSIVCNLVTWTCDITRSAVMPPQHDKYAAMAVGKPNPFS